MELVSVIRHKVLTEGLPIRDVARQLGLSRNTIRRYVRAKAVPVPKPPSPPRATPARAQVADAAAAIWASRRTFTAGKQRLTATRLWELLREDGHDVGARTVRRLVASFRDAEREVTVPLVYAAGDLAQVDFFEVWVDVKGVREKAWLFLMRLMHSGRDFTMICAKQDTTWFLAAHVAAFVHFAGVVAAVAYDNLSAAVAKIVIGAPRVVRPRFAAMVAHYAFEARFCRPGEGHDKGGVESRGGHIRWQHLVPVPRGQSLEEISAALQTRVDAQHARDAARTAAWESERLALRTLPQPFDGRQVCAVQLRHHASHAVGGAHYSIPSRWCGHTVDLFLGTDTVSFAYGDEVVCHPRKPFGGRSVDYLHHLLPLSRKPQALRQVVRDLVAQFGPPWPELWESLRACYAPDELEAARRLAPWLERADRQGLAAIAPRIRAAIADGSLVSSPKRNTDAETLAEVPAALRLYAIESPDLGRYDALLDAGKCSA